MSSTTYLDPRSLTVTQRLRARQQACSNGATRVTRALAGYGYVYRIRQVDIDGNASYSTSVRAALPGKATTLLQVKGNPFAAQLQFALTVPEAGSAEVRLLNAQGAEIQHRTLSLSAGETIVQLPTAALPQGIYFLVVKTARGEFRQQVIK